MFKRGEGEGEKPDKEDAQGRVMSNALKDSGIVAAGIGMAKFVEGIWKNSTLTSSIMNSFMKVFGHFADLITLALLPLLLPTLRWLVTEVRPFVKKISDWIGGDSELPGILGTLDNVARDVAKILLGIGVANFLLGGVPGKLIGGIAKTIDQIFTGGRIRGAFAWVGELLNPANWADAFRAKIIDLFKLDDLFVRISGIFNWDNIVTKFKGIFTLDVKGLMVGLTDVLSKFWKAIEIKIPTARAFYEFDEIANLGKAVRPSLPDVPIRALPDDISRSTNYADEVTDLGRAIPTFVDETGRFARWVSALKVAGTYLGSFSRLSSCWLWGL